MPIRQVYFASRAYAESLPAHPAMAVISITDPGKPEASLAPDFRDVLRLAFYDALPADEYLPAPIPGLFDQSMARRIGEFVHELHTAPSDIAIMVHCECGVSRSTAVALFVEAYAGARLVARELTQRANPWVLDRLLCLHPDLQIEFPS